VIFRLLYRALFLFHQPRTGIEGWFTIVYIGNAKQKPKMTYIVLTIYSITIIIRYVILTSTSSVCHYVAPLKVESINATRAYYSYFL